MVEAATQAQFCCRGCRTAFEILHDSGLDQYYGFSERRDAPVRPTGRTYEEFDHAKFRELYVRGLPDGLAQVELFLEGVHCASCVWLVERVPRIVHGVAGTELDIGRSRARVVWNPATVPLSRVARALDALGYAPHPFRGVAREAIRRREDRAMLARIGVAGAIAGNVMLASFALYSGWLGGMEHQYARFFRWVSLIVVTPAMVWPARVFFSGAWSALRTRSLHMDVPIAIGLGAGYVRGALNTIHDVGPIYFDGLAALIFALLVGRYLLQRGQRAAADGAELLASLVPFTARIVSDDGSVREIPSAAVVPDMLIDVRPGETLAADGILVTGRSLFDVSLLTGESRPISGSPGDRVYAGTLNLSSPVRVRVEHSGEESRVAVMLQLVEESRQRRAPVVETANRLAAWFVGVTLVLAALTFVAWRAIDPARAADNAIALLIVTCPCALALSTPLAVSVAIGRAAKSGILIKGGDALEQLSRPGRILLDKTGTITAARTSLMEWHGPDWARRLVLALEADSAHPIAAGLRAAWADVVVPPARASEHIAGGGIAGTVEGRDVVVGSPRFVSARTPVQARQRSDLDLNPVLTPVIVAVDGEIVASAGLGDPIRAGTAAAIQSLQARGWDVGILSGDVPTVVSAIGRTLGLPSECCVGGRTPEQKRDAVVAARGDRPVVMVGDGVNDAAAIAAAQVGIGVHGGAEACLATADVYLATPGLGALVRLVAGAERTMHVIRRNIGFSLVYNLIGATLAITGRISPLIAAILMPASSLTVVVASWRSQTFSDADR
jgi:P-type Cu2+ transporter